MTDPLPTDAADTAKVDNAPLDRLLPIRFRSGFVLDEIPIACVHCEACMDPRQSRVDGAWKDGVLVMAVKSICLQCGEVSNAEKAATSPSRFCAVVFDPVAGATQYTVPWAVPYLWLKQQIGQLLR